MPEVLDALTHRRARRAFDPRPVPADVQEALWKALQVAPSHGNSQSVRVLVAQGSDVRERLIAALSKGNQNWAPAAPLLFALTAVPSHDLTIEGADGSVRELWAFHAGIAAGNILAQATAMGLTAHPMAAFDEAAVRAAFEAPPEVRVLAIFAVGYPGEVESLPEDLQRRETSGQERLGLERLVGIDRWDPEMGVSWQELRRQARG
jgi:nitroreductase